MGVCKEGSAGGKGMWGREGISLSGQGSCPIPMLEPGIPKKPQLLLTRRVVNSVIPSLSSLPDQKKKKIHKEKKNICVFCRDLGLLWWTQGCRLSVGVKMQLSQENLMCLGSGWLWDEVKNLSPGAKSEGIHLIFPLPCQGFDYGPSKMQHLKQQNDSNMKFYPWEIKSFAQAL